MFGAVMLASNGKAPQLDGPWLLQGVGFLAMTLPVLLYFVLGESSAWRGSLGKRALGLVVVGGVTGQLSFRLALLRNAAKFAPWECGHMVAHQLACSGDGAPPPWIWGPAAIAFLCPAWWLLALGRSGRVPYDRWTGTRVTLAAEASQARDRRPAARGAAHRR